MILNPNAKKILCYGDSITWNFYQAGKRHPLENRWTYMLQEKVEDAYDVLDEGLRSRTTTIEDPDWADREGFGYFRACFEAHEPVDVLVLQLGTNDTKFKFNRTPEEIAEGVKVYIEWVRKYNTERGFDTKIIILTPPQLVTAHHTEFIAKLFDASSAEKIAPLTTLLHNLAEQENVGLADLSDLSGGEADGIHMDVENNRIIADRIFKKINTL